MGNFAGHALPGTFFLLFGIYWCVHVTRRYVACKTAEVPFYSSVTFPCFLCCRSLSFEGTVKVIVTSIGIIGELIFATAPMRDHSARRHGDFHGVYMGDIQHVSMYMWFLLAGIVDILMAMPPSTLRLPSGLDYVVSSLAFVAQFLLFYFHTHGQNQLEMTVHTLLLYVIALCALVVLLECRYRGSFVVAIVRCYCVFLQGTWFYQIGFILYPPFPWEHHWDGYSHEHIMLATAIFTWHMAVDLALVLLLCGVTYYVSRKHFPVRIGSYEYMWTRQNAMGLFYRTAISSSSTSDEDTL